MIYVIDLFCGAGGYTTGVERARAFGKKAAKVIACVNHDPYAIQSHRVNHKRVWHFIEDIRTLDVGPLAAMISTLRKREPGCIILLHASCECCHYSLASGGLSKNADSRTLHEHLYRYVEALNPDIITIENVVEFRTAGPLRLKSTKETKTECVLAIDRKGGLILVPDKTRSGEGFREWINQMTSYGYTYEDTNLNAADFGAHTKRNRYFGQFVKPGIPLVWPSPTHSKKPSKGSGLKKWKPVKDVLDLTDEGNSIFGRKKKLVDKSLMRIYSGLIKYVAGGLKAYNDVKKEYYLNHQRKAYGLPINSEAVAPDNENAFIQKYYSSGGNTSSLLAPLGALTTKDRDAVVSCLSANFWLDKNYSGQYNHQSMNTPAGAITTKDHYSLVEAQNFNFLDRQFSQGTKHQGLNSPAGALLTVPKMNLVSANVAAEHFLLNPQFSSKGGSIDDACFTLIARMDKASPGIISVEHNLVPELYIKILESDTEAEFLIKEFMAIYSLSDIKMRMLRVDELKKIQGFPENYYLAGNQARQKKSIGNSVAPVVPKALLSTIAEKLARIELAYMHAA